MADGEWHHVYGIGRFQGRLIVSMAGFRDSISAENLDFASLVMWENGQGWDSVDASPYLRMGTTQSPDSARFFFRKGVEWNGKFYAATSENVWSLDAGGRVWTKLPEIPRLIPCTRDYAYMPVNDVTVHHGKLYYVESSFAGFRWKTFICRRGKPGSADGLYGRLRRALRKHFQRMAHNWLLV